MSHNDALGYDAWVKINGCEFCISHLEDENARWCMLCRERWLKDTINTDEIDKLIAAYNSSISSTCSYCGLQGKPKDCPKCGRKACDQCVAVDDSDCMFCGPHGDIAKECFTALHNRNKSRG